MKNGNIMGKKYIGKVDVFDLYVKWEKKKWVIKFMIFLKLKIVSFKLKLLERYIYLVIRIIFLCILKIFIY